MMIEEKRNVTVMTGSKAELEEYKAKHDLKKEDGICILTANVPEDAYYKEKIKQLEKEKADLIKELNKTLTDLLNVSDKSNEQSIRIRKLEEAFIEAAIR